MSWIASRQSSRVSANRWWFGLQGQSSGKRVDSTVQTSYFWGLLRFRIFMSTSRPALLCILDGWGWRPDHAADNAIAAAKTPNYTRLLAECPHALLATSGGAVGLPRGQMGNSEVGHMNIGAGRVVAQDLPRIDVAIEEDALASRPVLQHLIETARRDKGALHIMGLLSPGGVHSHQDHIAALVKAADGIPVFVHAFLDGR